MRPDSLGAEILAGGLTVLAAVAAGYAWDLVRGRWRWAVRSVSISVSVLLAAATIGIGVNRQLELFPAWVDVVGAGGGSTDAVPAATDAQGSQVVKVPVQGRHSHLSLAAYVYLPAAYRTAAGARERFPVIETFAGFPGSPGLWLHALGAQHVLDTEIAARRMPPTIMVFPFQTTPPTHDSECVDAAGGQHFDTFLGVDVPETIGRDFRARTDRAGWATLGVSTGGFCAVNVAMRHPDRFGAAVSLSGYFTALTDHTTGDLYRGSRALRAANSPQWRIRHLPVPQLSVFLGCAGDDRAAVDAITRFEAADRPPVRISRMIIKRGGHSGRVWRAMEPVVLDWLGARLAAPEPLTGT